jgi:hypothetical protein
MQQYIVTKPSRELTPTSFNVPGKPLESWQMHAREMRSRRESLIGQKLYLRNSLYRLYLRRHPRNIGQTTSTIMR